MAGNGQALILAGKDAAAKRPPQWDKRLSAAYLRILGASQADTAKAEGVCERTIWGWEHDPTWPKAEAEAATRWLNDTTAASRKTILESIRQGDVTSARWVLERTVPELMPPAQQENHQHQHLHDHKHDHQLNLSPRAQERLARIDRMIKGLRDAEARERQDVTGPESRSEES